MLQPLLLSIQVTTLYSLLPHSRAQFPTLSQPTSPFPEDDSLMVVHVVLDEREDRGTPGELMPPFVFVLINSDKSTFSTEMATNGGCLSRVLPAVKNKYK